MALHEEFQNDMVYLLLLGMGKMGRILGQESYVETARVAIGLGKDLVAW